MLNENSQSGAAVDNPYRPFGVWVFSLADGVGGVYFFLATTYFYFWPLPGSKFQSPIWAAFLAFVSLGICLSAVLAWARMQIGRNALLTFISIYFILLIIQHGADLFMVISYGHYLRDAHAKNFVVEQLYQLAILVIWLAINYWYFLGKATQTFYVRKQNQS